MNGNGTAVPLAAFSENHTSTSHGTLLIKGEEILNTHTHSYVGSSLKPGTCHPTFPSSGPSSREMLSTCAAPTGGLRGSWAEATQLQGQNTMLSRAFTNSDRLDSMTQSCSCPYILKDRHDIYNNNKTLGFL